MNVLRCHDASVPDWAVIITVPPHTSISQALRVFSGTSMPISQEPSAMNVRGCRAGGRRQHNRSGLV